ncbi:DNA mismatch repair protein MutT [Rufibacter radiotolerans]|uniref:GDP-mannose pyrophosphatase n=1 Tax=Rufibacter radiotolerans TaxID=1379910 RepID=A0A0H4W721_9BACT|nr:NUDIX hydrolase [Rufibacter radiotolerans]AKQ46226.1 DNA mismatch repair protein MutT [Rufibacter radiotolerans]
MKPDHSTENPWTSLDSKPVYSNPWISVREEQVINPGGGQGIYGIVSMKNKAIGIVPVDEEGNTWLVGQYRYPLKEYSWEIPMGGGPVEQDVLESAKRELKEETGFTAEEWTMIARLHTSNSVTDEEGFVFLAEELTAGETEFEETEDIKIWKLPLSEAVRMVMDNEITDAISVAGLLKAEKILLSRRPK